MANMGCAKTCIDPSPFLFTLENFVKRSGRSSFVVNSQQDAAEVLEHVLNELIKQPIQQRLRTELGYHVILVSTLYKLKIFASFSS